MSRYSDELLLQMKNEDELLYQTIGITFSLPGTLLAYLEFKHNNSIGCLEAQISEALISAKADDTASGFMYLDAASLFLIMGNFEKSLHFANKSIDCFDWQILTSKKEEILRDIYKDRKQEADYFSKNIKKAYDLLESGYSHFARKYDIDKILPEIALENRVNAIKFQESVLKKIKEAN